MKAILRGLGRATLSRLEKMREPQNTLTTVILDVVRVPVLSLQIVVADPMVSHADRCRTRFWSLSIFLTLKARAMVTARGRPSGTATTKMVTPEMRKESTSDQCTWLSHDSLQQWLAWNENHMRTKRTTTVRAAKAAPPCVMASVIASSFCWRTDLECSASASTIFCCMVPWYVWVPTATTSIRPSPSCTKVPAKMIGARSTLFSSALSW
mmetsp:Transcript_24053/g.60441  ORF Transcript_24053/g.60441 Transcript_24053/m.60441 type:complete len:210 (-) Transcript_24053:1344-1973(-)